MRDKLKDQPWNQDAYFVVNIMYLVIETGESEDPKVVSPIVKDKASQPLERELTVSASYCFVTSCSKNSEA